MLETKIEELFNNRLKVPDEFWVKAENGNEVIWFLDQEDGSAGSYETSQERLGMTKSGKIIWGFSSGCSCWDGWGSTDYCPTKDYKEFQLSDFENERKEKGSYHLKELSDWKESMASNLNDFLFLISENPDPKDVLKLKNAEIRRYMIKRVGYEHIKDAVQAELIHKDGDYELLDLVIEGNKERYVKVKDSSTDREYLLYVDRFVKTCKEGVAWTFGLTESEYNPLIET